ncbi:MAG TPA: DUF4398 domain-containing protein, partial [Candidatus Bilamarchaeaceae archaeon]|nr:DUF4398 domain-containing protein [Candidatus Bilamarchaeaceae archaeon]
NCVLKPTPEPPTPDDSQAEALEGLNRAQQQLDQAKKEGKDVAEAQKKLDEAKEAYEEGDYERAKQLLSDVESFIMESLKFEDDKTIVTQPKQDEKKESEKQEEDISSLLIFGVVAIVGLSLLTVIYFFSKKK